MNDMLGRELVFGDLVFIDGRLAKVIKSYSNTLKLAWITSMREPVIDNVHEFGTSMNEKVLKLNDFDIEKVNEKLVPEIVETLNNYITPSARRKTAEEKAEINSENRRRNALKAETRVGSLIKDGNYNWFLYIGRHRKINRDIDDPDNTMYHTYVELGGAYSTRTPNQIVERVTDLSGHSWYSSYCIVQIKGLKQPEEIYNTHNDLIIEFFKGDEIHPNSSEYMRNNRNLISSLLNA